MYKLSLYRSSSNMLSGSLKLSPTIAKPQINVPRSIYRASAGSTIRVQGLHTTSIRFQEAQKNNNKNQQPPKFFDFKFGSFPPPQPPKNGKAPPPPPPPPSWVTIVGIASSLVVSYAFLRILGVGGFDGPEVTWEELRRDYLDKGLVARIQLVNNRLARVFLRTTTQGMSNDVVHFTVGSADTFEKNLDNAQDELGISVNERIPVSYSQEVDYAAAFLSSLPMLLLVGGLLFVVRAASRAAGGGGPGGMGFSKSTARLFNQENDVKIKFKDVAGADEAKAEIMEFVEFLQNPKKYEKLGARIPRGAILSGPPGTGKTLIAKATAGEAGVPFLSVSGSEFVEMLVGVGARRVRDLFETARKMAPSIVFIDEIDAIGKKRGQGGGHDERESTLNQLLVEMDGFASSDHVIVMAGTNRADVLDPALLRPGRFDRHVTMDNPDISGRRAIFDVYLKKIKTNVDLEYLRGRLAALTPGFSGADVSNCVNEAALIAARDNAKTVEMTHFERAIERVIAGLEKKSRVLGPEEKKTVAFHEAGHAICGWYLEYANPLLKVSIVPRGQALGYAQYVPSDVQLLSENELVDQMIMTLGGRTSEELHFSTVTSGASDDFRKVTQIATAMVTQWGMSKKIGWLNFEEDEGHYSKPFSEDTGALIDEEVRRIVSECHKKCTDLLNSKMHEISLVANELLSKEVLTRDDMVRLLGKRDFPERNPEVEQYFDNQEPPMKKQDEQPKNEA